MTWEVGYFGNGVQFTIVNDGPLIKVLEHFQPDRNRPSEAGGPRLIKMLYKQQAGAAGRMSTIFQTG
jgi:hypothetical protein